MMEEAEGSLQDLLEKSKSLVEDFTRKEFDEKPELYIGTHPGDEVADCVFPLNEIRVDEKSITERHLMHELVHLLQFQELGVNTINGWYSHQDLRKFAGKLEIPGFHKEGFAKWVEGCIISPDYDYIFDSENLAGYLNECIELGLETPEDFPARYTGFAFYDAHEEVYGATETVRTGFSYLTMEDEEFVRETIESSSRELPHPEIVDTYFENR